MKSCYWQKNINIFMKTLIGEIGIFYKNTR